MDNWLIFAKLCTLTYCCIKYIQGEMANVAPVIFSILLYISINMVYYILKNSRLKTTFLVMSLLLVSVCSLYYNILFVLLIPLNVFELSYRLFNKINAPVIVMLILSTLFFQDIAGEYFLIAVLHGIIFKSLQSINSRINHLAEENDNLREKNHLLYQRLDRDEEYRRQLVHLSHLEERNNIAQKIHDRVGHAISGSLIQLEAASLMLKKDSKKAEMIIHSVISTLRDGMESIRATLRSIKPSSEQLGINRLKAMLDEFSLKHDIRTTLHYDGNLENITPIHWRIINENTTEGLTNALKHSKCTSISVNVEVLNKIIKYEIKDNGVGVKNLRKGIGIRGIEERSGSVGGKVIIDGSRGFSVITLLPLEEDKYAD
jgi:signal transduction histidine kinase